MPTSRISSPPNQQDRADQAQHDRDRTRLEAKRAAREDLWPLNPRLDQALKHIARNGHAKDWSLHEIPHHVQAGQQPQISSPGENRSKCHASQTATAPTQVAFVLPKCNAPKSVPLSASAQPVPMATSNV